MQQQTQRQPFLERVPEPLRESFDAHCRATVEAAPPVSDYRFDPEDGFVDMPATIEEIIWSLRRDYETQLRYAAQRGDRECVEDAETQQRLTAEFQGELHDYLAGLWTEVRGQ